MEVARKEKTPADDVLADVCKGSKSISKHADTVERYGKARSRAILQFAYMDEHYPREKYPQMVSLIERMNHCGNYLKFRNYYTVDTVTLHQASFCKCHLLCPLCAIRRASKQTAAALEKLTVVLESRPDLKPYLLTYTVKNGADLGERFAHLQKALKKLNQKRRDHQRGKTLSEFGKCEGGLYSVEFTHSNQGWHPHIHMVVLCDPGNLPDFPLGGTGIEKKDSALSREWAKITKDSFIVDFRPIDQENPVTGVIEVMKYALKFSNLSPAKTAHAWETLTGSRLVGAFGCLWGVKLDQEDLTDEPLENLPYFEIFYIFQYGSGYNAVAV